MIGKFGSAAMVLLLAASAGPATAQYRSGGGTQASFDCNRATTRAERLICGDGTLRSADRALASLYASALRRRPGSDRAGLVASQRAWLRERDACTDRNCLLTHYMARQNRLLVAVADHSRGPLARIGQCQETAITEIGPRLEGGDRPDDSGTSVGFANGLSQVSYELERAVARSHLGDRVRMCLVSIPRDCPPGDDRGREYAVTNLRTGEQWRLPDSEHMCGGA